VGDAALRRTSHSVTENSELVTWGERFRDVARRCTGKGGNTGSRLKAHIFHKELATKGGGGVPRKTCLAFRALELAIRWLLHENVSLEKLPCSAAALFTWQDSKSVSEACIFII
jgi:hypothetical protein